MATIAEALQFATTTLAAASPTPRLDAEVLLGYVLVMSRATLIAERNRSLSLEEEARFRHLIERRAALEPVAYIVGCKEFYGLEFAVDARVLVPRPETESLIDLAIQWFKQQPHASLKIADIGTGSGCIAVTLAVHLPQARLYAVDLSPDALDLAHENATRHHVADRITFVQGDGCAPLIDPVDLIVTNPPYAILSDVDPNVYRWEPHLALDGGGMDGFAIPARLLREMPRCLRSGGAVLMEIAAWQGHLALETAQAIFSDARCTIHQDLARHDRVLMVER